MTNRKYKLYAPFGLWVFAIVILTDMCCYIYGQRIPYLFEEEAILNRFYLIFPAIWIFFIYFIFLHKWKVSGQTGFQMQHSKRELENLRFKIKSILHLVFWTTFFSAALAWMTWGIPACGSYFYSKQPVTREFVVDKLRGAGNSGVDVGLVDKADGVKYLLKQPGYLSLGVPWSIGDNVCAQGRTSLWGTIVEDFKSGVCN